jgi:hypothetical protein
MNPDKTKAVWFFDCSLELKVKVLANILYDLPGTLEISLHDKGIARLDRVRFASVRRNDNLALDHVHKLPRGVGGLVSAHRCFPSPAESFLRTVLDPGLHGGLAYDFLPTAEIVFNHIGRLFWQLHKRWRCHVEIPPAG